MTLRPMATWVLGLRLLSPPGVAFCVPVPNVHA